MTKTKWVVAWIYNEKSHSEEYDSLILAQMRAVQLETFGMRTSIHEKVLTEK